MKKLLHPNAFIPYLIGVLANLPTVLIAEPCLYGLDDEDAQFVNEVQELDVNDLIGRIDDALMVVENSASTFCANYEVGRFFVNAGNNERAKEFLQAAISLATDEDFRRFAPENVLGFIELSEQNFEGASDLFEKQISREQFNDLSALTRSKVLNNAGYTYMVLGRYDDASEPLTEAAALGSVRANRNLEALQSLVATAKGGDISAPGVFGVVLATGPTIASAEAMKNTLAADLEMDEISLQLFRTPNGRISVSFEPYVSYTKALQNANAARQGGIDDAFLASLTGWEPILGTEQE